MRRTTITQNPPPTSVLHLEGDDKHAVLIQSLRVVIVQDGEQWFAQGLELDYAAVGINQQDVKSRFEDGLAATIHEHLKVYGSVEKILKVAPQEAWNLWLAQGQRYKFDQASFHPIQTAGAEIYDFPFRGIAYLESEALPQAA